MGAVSTNVLNGLSAAVVLVGGHVWFCGRDVGQCLDWPKVIGCVVVGLGCVGYALGSGGEAHKVSHAHGGQRGGRGHEGLERNEKLTREENDIGLDDSRDVLMN